MTNQKKLNELRDLTEALLDAVDNHGLAAAQLGPGAAQLTIELDLGPHDEIPPAEQLDAVDTAHTVLRDQARGEISRLGVTSDPDMDGSVILSVGESLRELEENDYKVDEPL